MNTNTTTNGGGKTTVAGRLVVAALGDIVASATNPRKTFNGPDWPDFVESVRTHGVIQPGLARPLLGQPTKLELVAGERRWRASKEAKLATMPLMLREDLTDAEVVELQQIENLQREDLSPLEEAQGYADWRDSLLKGGTVKTVEEAVTHIAAKINRKRTMVYSRLALLKTAPVVQKALSEGKLDASKAALIAQIPDPKDQAELLKAAADEEEPMSYRDLKAEIEQGYRVSLKNAPFSQEQIFTSVKLDGKQAPLCKTCPYRTGNILDAGGDPNVCTNPECFRAKCAASAGPNSQTIAGVWDEKTFEKNRYSNQWVQPDADCWEDASKRTWETILGKFAPPAFIAVGRSHRSDSLELMRFWKWADVLKIAKDNKLLKVAGPRKPSAEELKYKKEREERRRKEEEKKQQVAERLVGVVNIANSLLEKDPLEFWRVMAFSAIETARDNGFELCTFKGRGGLPFDDQDDELNAETLVRWVKEQKSHHNLVCLAVELGLLQASDYAYGSEKSARELALDMWPAAKDEPAKKKPTPPAIVKIAAKAKASKAKAVKVKKGK